MMIREISIAIFSAVLGGALVAVPTYLGANREMDVKMVEIAVGILSQKPEDAIAPARTWAVALIDHYSEIKPDAAAKAALANYQAVRGSYMTSYTTTYTPTYDDGPTRPSLP